MSNTKFFNSGFTAWKSAHLMSPQQRGNESLPHCHEAWWNKCTSTDRLMMFHFAFILRRPFTSINLFMEVYTRICKKTVTIDSLQVFSIPFKKQKVRIFIPQVGASVAIKEGFILRELRWKQENEKLTKFTNHQMC